ncbi:MAG: phenylalanine--tRNA ligase subunit alpha [Verrucomicrobiota bacterium]
MIQEKIEALKSEVLSSLEGVRNVDDLEKVRLQYFSRQGSVTQMMETMKTATPEERPVLGKLLNVWKTTLQQAFDTKKTTLEDADSGTRIDTTLPGRPTPVGSLHPIYQVRDDALEIFKRLGFALAEGPDIEFEFFNFDALNTPADHPARNEQDTFYIKGDQPHAEWGRRLLRTQTSPVQVRVMQSQKPPIRIIAPGRCYRRDEIDATHGLSFHQVEALVIDEGITLADMKGTMETFFRELLGNDLIFRFRPHFFPFTEPSFEVDCRRPGTTIKGKEWLEICGCGMVHPNVLKRGGIDPEIYSGFALGFGVERIAMMRYGVGDLRLFGENDVRMLRQLSVV